MINVKINVALYILTKNKKNNKMKYVQQATRHNSYWICISWEFFSWNKIQCHSVATG